MISHLPGLGGGDGQLTSGQPLTEERFVAKVHKALAASILPLDKKKLPHQEDLPTHSVARTWLTDKRRASHVSWLFDTS